MAGVQCRYHDVRHTGVALTTSMAVGTRQGASLSAIAAGRSRRVCSRHMNVSLPDQLRAFVDEQVGGGSYGSTSEYVRELIRRDQDRQRLRRLLLEGAESEPGPLADGAYFTSLRDRLDDAG